MRPVVTSIHPFLRLAHHLRPQARRVWFLVALGIVGTVPNLIQPQIGRYLIDHLLKKGQSFGQIGMALVVLAVITVANQVISMYSIWKEELLEVDLRAHLRQAYFDCVMRMSASDLARTRGVSVTLGFVDDIDQVVNFVIKRFVFLLVLSLKCVFIIIIVAGTSPLLTLLVCLPIPLAYTVLLRSRLRKLLAASRSWHERARCRDFFAGTLAGFREIKIFNAENWAGQTFSERVAGHRHFDLLYRELLQKTQPLLALLSSAGSLLIWAVGSVLVVRGRLTVGQVVAYAAYMGTLYASLQSLCTQILNSTSLKIACEKVTEVLDFTPDVVPPREPLWPASPRGRLQAKGVCFSYRRDRRTLVDINLTIEPGEMIGLVGPSGAGKTTLVNLLVRLFDPDEGMVTLSGIALNQLDLVRFRQAVAMVPQNPVLFEGSIAENLALGRPGATLREICTAADRAQAHDFIMGLKDAYETRLIPGDTQLSVGEQQRLTIARALLRDPIILVLDEATAAVDNKTERQIQAALAELISGRTTIAIAHRLSTLVRADRLVVMKGGRIVDIGTHATLAVRCQTYAELLPSAEQVVREWAESERHGPILGQ
jgi:ATP-binding cassette subfamily B protein